MIRCLLVAFACLAAPSGAVASICQAFVEGVPGVRFAQLDTPVTAATDAAGLPGEVTIEYITHSSYRITTPADVVIVTDFFGGHGHGRLPDVVTMNHAHSTHYTNSPNPAIPHVLRGWNPAGAGPAEHMLEVRDTFIRNVTTDIRGWGAPEADGNSIFIFEVANLCIGHLGHLHHELDDAQHAMIGRLDIVMAPVDGTYTLDLPTMIKFMQRLKARIVLPMHAFGPNSMSIFIDGLSEDFSIRRVPDTKITVSTWTLPGDPTLVLLSNHHYGRVD